MVADRPGADIGERQLWVRPPRTIRRDEYRLFDSIMPSNKAFRGHCLYFITRLIQGQSWPHAHSSSYMLESRRAISMPRRKNVTEGDQKALARVTE